MKSYLDITYAQRGDEQLMLDIFTPDAGEFDVFVYFHGGGLKAGTKDCGRESFIPYLIDCAVATVSVEYRMYPTHTYPDFLVDAADAVKYVMDHISEYGDAKRIFVGGSSAGGYISMMLCFDKTWYEGAGVDPFAVSGYVHDAGQPTAHFQVLKYRGTDPRRVIVDTTAPLYHIGEAEKYPPMHFIVSDNDMTNRYEQTMLTISTLAHFGHTDTVSHTLMHGGHCAYVERKDDGESAFGKLIAQFIESVK